MLRAKEKCCCKEACFLQLVTYFSFFLIFPHFVGKEKKLNKIINHPVLD